MATVLVVDDDPTIRDFMRVLLGYRGHQACEASDGDGALLLAGRQPPDAVITDVLMPGLDGYELARILRSQPATSHIPIAFSTAHYGWNEIEPLALACGVRDVIFKPAKPSVVLATIDSLLGVGRVPEPVQVSGSAQEFLDQHRLLLKAKLLEKTGALRLSEGRLRAIATTASVGVLLADRTGSATYVNPRLAEILGRSETTLAGAGWLEMLDPAGRQRLLSSITTGTFVDGARYRLATTGGDARRRLDVRIHAVDDVVAGDIVVIVEDVTADLRHIRAADERAGPGGRQAAYLADRLAETQHVTNSGTWDLDLAGDAVVLSADLRDLLRLPSTRIRLAELSRRVHPEDLARVVTMAEDTVRTGSPHIAEVRLAELDGSVHELIVSCRTAPVSPPTGPPTQPPRMLWGVAHDVTEIRQSQRARLREQADWHAERRTVESLHRAILPRALPAVSGIDLAAVYLTAPERLDIGAAWYDALPLDEGRVLLSVGHVAGHDDQPAAVTGPVVAVLRAYALDDPDPAAVLTRLNRFLTATRGDDAFVTAVVALYEPGTGELRVANAGHCPPLLVSRDHDRAAVATPQAGPGPALGIFVDAQFTGYRLRLGPDTALCLYTDGLTDRHGDPGAAVRQPVARVAAQALDAVAGGSVPGGATAQRLAERIVSDVLGHSPPDGDTCLVVLWTGTNPSGG